MVKFLTLIPRRKKKVRSGSAIFILTLARLRASVKVPLTSHISVSVTIPEIQTLASVIPIF